MLPLELLKPGSYVSDKQPDHGQSHVRSLHEIQIGKPYIRHYRTAFDPDAIAPPEFKQEMIVVVDMGEIDQNQDSPTLQIRNLDSFKPRDTTGSTLGLAPFMGKWQTDNWLEDPSRNKAT